MTLQFSTGNEEQAIENHVYNQIQHHHQGSSVLFLEMHLTISKLYREEEKKTPLKNNKKNKKMYMSNTMMLIE